MSGAQFWITAALFVASVGMAYVIGYRTGWTDGQAEMRKWAGK